ncbi:hypothetical protein HJFPF1_02527 [Paramyrothecium foliicola]|nr:hypothetical protein HJFPF1_02527 [Paramyrothecium foliicola]
MENQMSQKPTSSTEESFTPSKSAVVIQLKGCRSRVCTNERGNSRPVYAISYENQRTCDDWTSNPLESWPMQLH